MEHRTHPQHDHTHGAGCGHTSLRHGDHVDFLHDGHLHSIHGDHVDEHVLTESAKAECASHPCTAHTPEHHHGANCGHEAVPHGDHTDYVVDAHLHHQHEAHCDNHGELQLA